MLKIYIELITVTVNGWYEVGNYIVTVDGW